MRCDSGSATRLIISDLYWLIDESKYVTHKIAPRSTLAFDRSFFSHECGEAYERQYESASNIRGSDGRAGAVKAQFIAATFALGANVSAIVRSRGLDSSQFYG